MQNKGQIDESKESKFDVESDSYESETDSDEPNHKAPFSNTGKQKDQFLATVDNFDSIGQDYVDKNSTSGHGKPIMDDKEHPYDDGKNDKQDPFNFFAKGNPGMHETNFNGVGSKNPGLHASNYAHGFGNKAKRVQQSSAASDREEFTSISNVKPKENNITNDRFSTKPTGAGQNAQTQQQKKEKFKFVDDDDSDDLLASPKNDHSRDNHRSVIEQDQSTIDVQKESVDMRNGPGNAGNSNSFNVDQMEFGKNRKGRNADNVMYGVDSDALKPEYESAGKKTLPITSKINDDDDIINKMTRDIEEQYKVQEKPTDGLQDSNYDSIDRAQTKILSQAKLSDKLSSSPSKSIKMGGMAGMPSQKP